MVLRFSVAYEKPYGLVVKTQAAPHGPCIESRTGDSCRSKPSWGGRVCLARLIAEFVLSPMRGTLGSTETS